MHLRPVLGVRNIIATFIGIALAIVTVSTLTLPTASAATASTNSFFFTEYFPCYFDGGHIAKVTVQFQELGGGARRPAGYRYYGPDGITKVRMTASVGNAIFGQTTTNPGQMTDALRTGLQGHYRSMDPMLARKLTITLTRSGDAKSCTVYFGF